MESREALMERLYCEYNQALIRFLMTRVDSEQEAQDGQRVHESVSRALGEARAPGVWAL